MDGEFGQCYAAPASRRVARASCSFLDEVLDQDKIFQIFRLVLHGDALPARRTASCLLTGWLLLPGRK